MHFLKMVKKLTKENKGRKLYAYASHRDNAWLLRMHVTRAGDPILEYTLSCHTCEEEHPHYYRIYNPSGSDMGQDWQLTIPKEWVKPAQLQWMEDSSKECRSCAHMAQEPMHFCVRYHKFVSPLMGCKKHITNAEYDKQLAAWEERIKRQQAVQEAANG